MLLATIPTIFLTDRSFSYVWVNTSFILKIKMSLDKNVTSHSFLNPYIKSSNSAKYKDACFTMSWEY